jgi:hypothetical protein
MYIQNNEPHNGPLEGYALRQKDSIPLLRMSPIIIILKINILDVKEYHTQI